MKFISQICTNKEQSERLLALGLKKETSDCVVSSIGSKDRLIHTEEPIYIMESLNSKRIPNYPAWSLHRLIEIIPNRIKYKNDYYHFNIFSDNTRYTVDYVDPDDNYYNSFGHCHNNLFESIISLIEWLIKEDYFDKKYLK